MIKNYLKTAWRNMRRNRTNSIINIAGLAIAIACVIMIIMYVQDEFSYDKFFAHSDHIFQLTGTGTDNGVEYTTGGNTAPAAGPTMQSMYPEIEAYARIYRPGDVLVRYEENNGAPDFYTEKKLLAVDSNFLQVFNYAMLKGNAASCLEKPNSVVITEATAKKYFGSAEAIGKTLLFDTDKKPFVVTAVLKNTPSNASFQFDMLASIHAYKEVKKRSWNWHWLQVNTYIKLKNNIGVDPASIARLEAKFPLMVKEHMFDNNGGQSYDDFVKKGGKLSFSLMPFTAVHLHAIPMEVPARLTTLSDIKYIYIFSVIALFIIILACANFMNLSTAQSATRAKEVGIRKVMGSLRIQLIKQFIAEATLYSFIATLIAMILVAVLLPPFNALSGKSMLFSSIFTSTTWIFVLGLFLTTTMLAGLYPAFYITRFNPAEVLKGLKQFKNGISNLLVRDGLVVLQFTISIALIVCTMVVYQQLRYAQEKDLGIDKENVLVIANTSRLGKSEETFRQELKKVHGLIDASASTAIPTKNGFEDTYNPEGTETEKVLVKEFDLSSYMVDEDFVQTMGMHLLQGRNFSKDFNDSASVILNETALQQIGWKNPVGKWLAYPGNNQRFQVIGVVKDFNIESLRDAVQPFALFNSASKTYYTNSSFISVRLPKGNVSANMSAIEDKWKSFAPDIPFDYSFMDADFDAMYRSENRMGSVFTIFASLSIFVACLGLFGLSIFTAERRKKEISVRKILGATVPGIIQMLSKDFIRLVAIAFLFAAPLAWWAMSKWLESFAYRISISGWVFVAAGTGAILIALLTVLFQAAKAAVANPASSLRTEG
jgi:putative ABC transport system permease protein